MKIKELRLINFGFPIVLTDRECLMELELLGIGGKSLKKRAIHYDITFDFINDEIVEFSERDLTGDKFIEFMDYEDNIYSSFIYESYSDIIFFQLPCNKKTLKIYPNIDRILKKENLIKDWSTIYEIIKPYFHYGYDSKWKLEIKETYIIDDLHVFEIFSNGELRGNFTYDGNSFVLNGFVTKNANTICFNIFRYILNPAKK